MGDEKLFKVKVKGPPQGYRSIGKFFNADERAIAVSAAQRDTLKSEGILLVVDLPDDYEITSAPTTKKPTLEELAAQLEAALGRIAVLEGEAHKLQDLSDHVTDHDGELTSMTAQLQSIDGRVGAIEPRMDRAESRLSGVEPRVDKLDKAMAATFVPAAAAAAPAGDAAPAVDPPPDPKRKGK